jgi:hypothetical protein
MSNVCAKPGCSNFVYLWLDFAPNDQRVLERSSRGDSSVGLCETHAGRFSVPKGWTFERLEGSSGPVESSVANPDPTQLTHREHSRERPWFLAATERELGDDGIEANVPDAPGGRVSAEPAAGSLLHRAFHGPDRQMDADRAALDELESRRAIRTHNADGTIELPFPPNEPEQHVAVS